jgi:hypothetical protein
MPPTHVLQRKGNNIPQFCSFNMHLYNSEREIISLNFALPICTCTIVKMAEARLLSNMEDAKEASSGCHDSETPSRRLGD